MSQPWGDRSQSNSQGFARPPSPLLPLGLTFMGALRLKIIINTLVKSMFIRCSTNNNVGADNW